MENISVLQPYAIRIFLAANQSHVKNFVEVLKAKYKLDTLEVETVTLTAGDRSADFKRLTVLDLPPIYIILLENSKLGPRRVKSVFDLVAYTKGSPAIIYVHDSAITTFKLAVLHNFPIVLFHSEEDFKRYFESGILGCDDKEVAFVLKQKQDYVMKEIVFREDFAHMKEEKSHKRDKGFKNDSVQDDGEISEVNRSKKQNEVPKPIKKDNGKSKAEAPKKTEKAKKKANDFVEVTRHKPVKPVAEVPVEVAKTVQPKKSQQKASDDMTPVDRMSRQGPTKEVQSVKPAKDSVKKPWTLPSDAQSVSAVNTPALFDNLVAAANPWKK